MEESSSINVYETTRSALSMGGSGLWVGVFKWRTGRVRVGGPENLPDMGQGFRNL